MINSGACENMEGLAYMEAFGSDRSEELLEYLRRRSMTESEMINDLNERVLDCERKIKNVTEEQATVSLQITELNIHISRIADILEAWNNVKGFWSVMRLISNAAKVGMIIIGAILAVFIFIRTGHWIGVKGE